MNEFAAEAHDENELDKVVDHQTEKPVQVLTHKPGLRRAGHSPISPFLNYETLVAEPEAVNGRILCRGEGPDLSLCTILARVFLPGISGLEAFDLNPVAMHAGLGGIVTGLHFQEQIHTDAEGLFQAQGHLSGNRRLAVGYIGQRCAANAENFGRAGYSQTESLNDLFPDNFPRMGWILHCHGLFLLMIILLYGITLHMSSNFQPVLCLVSQCQAKLTQRYLTGYSPP